jgi:hypothetical protein
MISRRAGLISEGKIIAIRQSTVATPPTTKNRLDFVSNLLLNCFELDSRERTLDKGKR